MAKHNINSKKGFTIIEVVLVLAIAGLIFLMVFVALPALQRSQRDTQRRNDMSRVDTSLVQYQTNNSTRTNNLPNPGAGGSYYEGKDDFKEDNNCDDTNVACKFVRDYMNTGASGTEKMNEFQDPDGKPYSLFITENWDDLPSGTTTISGGPEALEDKITLITGDTTGSYTIGGDEPFKQYMIYIVPGGRCDGTSVVKSEKRHFAILYRLEGAGTYCIDDQ